MSVTLPGEDWRMDLPSAQVCHPVYDLVGVGFGPSNLALAIAVDEHNRAAPGRPVRAVFLERKQRFGWHQGMLVEDASMQVSFLKDLVTLRNPTSDFSFVAYLHERGRLVSFINHRALYPSRVEFHDYLSWAAERMADSVRYGAEVTEVRPVTEGGVVGAVDVIASGAGPPRVFRSRNIVIATGLEPALPATVRPSARVWHSADLLHRAQGLVDPRSFVVIGAGQSAAEVTAHLHERFPRAQVYSVFGRYGYRPADSSPFVNGIFDPAAVDTFYAAPPRVKEVLLDQHGNTNYSVVDEDLIEELYRRAYQESVRGDQRLHMMNMSEADVLDDSGPRPKVRIRSLATGETMTVEPDAVVCATGYRPADPAAVLGELSGFAKRDSTGRLRVERDYRVCTAGGVTCGIYLQGGTEHTHGLSSSLLSTISVRAGELLRSIAA